MSEPKDKDYALLPEGCFVPGPGEMSLRVMVGKKARTISGPISEVLAEFRRLKAKRPKP